MAKQDGPQRRRRTRWVVSIPCSASWGTGHCQADIRNISLDGALLAGADQVPEDGTEVALRFRFRERGIFLMARVTSEVVHFEHEGATDKWSFGVKFEVSLEKFWNDLLPVIRTIQAESAPQESSFQFPAI